MTHDDRRRAWLEAEMRKVPLTLQCGHTGHPCDAFVTRGTCGEAFRGHDWPAIAALLDAPLRELEEALEHTGLALRPCGCDTKIAYWCDSCRVKAALARLPWKGE